MSAVEPHKLEVLNLVDENDDGERFTASFTCAMGIAMHPSGDLYVADYDEHKLWRIDIQTGVRRQIELQNVDPKDVVNYPGALRSALPRRPFEKSG
jgi:sugar lactone lactonase YvrE